MKAMLFTAAILSALTFTACNNKTAETKPAAEQKEPEGINIKVSQLASNIDYNCQMKLEDGAINDTTTYKGKIYGFCSKDCKTAFLTDPEAHLAQK